MTPIILASSSPYRRQVLAKLGLDFNWETPDIDETPLAGETAASLVKRLAKEKALALAERYPESLIIGSDQVATLDQEILGKPHSHSRAKAQLLAANGRTLTFMTGLCLHNAKTKHNHISCETYSVSFRSLSKAQIDNYLLREKPYDCAGSFKSEGLGISLFDRLEGDDPNTLIGLPLIALIKMLDKEGLDVLGHTATELQAIPTQ